MQNPKEFKATPFDHFKPVPHSGPEPKMNPAEKKHPKEATPWSHKAPVAKSGKEGMGDLHQHPKSYMKSPAGPTVTPKSCPMAPVEPKKFRYPGKDDAGRG